MSARDKVQCPVRLYESDYNKARELASEDGLSFQKVVEVLMLNYIKRNRDVVNIVKKYAEESKKRKGTTFDETEKTSLLDRIEAESPIKHFG